MPIKFRCHHCNQLLGISRSRAGAVVDCPQCGRDLRVPELDGRTRRMPDARKATRSDSALLSALSELSVLDENDAVSAPLTTPSAGLIEKVAAVEEQAHVTVEPLPAAEPVDVEVIAETDESEPVPIAEYVGSTEESLAELATLQPHESRTEVSESLLNEMRAVSHPVGLSIASVIGGIFLLLCGLVAGWYLGRAKDGADMSLPALVQPEDNDDNNADNGADRGEVASGVSVSGQIQYLDESDQLMSDSGAFIVLLPAQRVGSVRLNARSLKQSEDHPDHRATAAALAAYGGAFAVADDDGRFLATVADETDLIAVVVSRHRERPDDLSVPPAVTVVLEQWFDSTSHLCGKLAVQMTSVSVNDPNITVQFGR